MRGMPIACAIAHAPIVQLMLTACFNNHMQVEGIGGGAANAANAAHAGAGGASTELLQRAIEGVQANAKRTFGSILDRANKTDRIKSVANLLNRFQNLFGMPSRIKVRSCAGAIPLALLSVCSFASGSADLMMAHACTLMCDDGCYLQALAQEGDLNQVVAEFKRANALIRPTPITARVWVSLYQEIEKVLAVAQILQVAGLSFLSV